MFISTYRYIFARYNLRILFLITLTMYYYNKFLKKCIMYGGEKMGIVRKRWWKLVLSLVLEVGCQGMPADWDLYDIFLFSA